MKTPDRDAVFWKPAASAEQIAKQTKTKLFELSSVCRVLSSVCLASRLATA